VTHCVTFVLDSKQVFSMYTASSTSLYWTEI